MAHGSFDLDGQATLFGFASVEDWFDSVILSFPAPWTIGPDTNYGTQIFDSREKHVLSIWMPFGAPSARQKGSMSDKEWSEYCCDSHWESETQWHLANAIITARNSLVGQRDFHNEKVAMIVLRVLIMNHAKWGKAVNAEILCGGPDRRRSDEDPAVRKQFGW